MPLKSGGDRFPEVLPFQPESRNADGRQKGKRGGVFGFPWPLSRRALSSSRIPFSTRRVSCAWRASAVYRRTPCVSPSQLVQKAAKDAFYRPLRLRSVDNKAPVLKRVHEHGRSLYWLIFFTRERKCVVCRAGRGKQSPGGGEDDKAWRKERRKRRFARPCSRSQRELFMD